MSNKWIISLLATGAADLLENSLIGIQNCGIDLECVHVVIPSGAPSDLQFVVRSFGATLRSTEDILGSRQLCSIPLEYADYGTVEFNKLMRIRFPIIQALARECDYIINADIDLVWLANPIPYLEKVLDQYSMAFQTESDPCFPPNFCCGFFAMKSKSTDSGELMRLHIERFSEDCPLTMQILFNSIIAENPDFLLKIFPLPEALFANGLLHSIIANRHASHPLLVDFLHPFTFHANFTIGGENKRRLLREADVWFADGVAPLK